MPTRDDIAWFKQQFASRIQHAIEGTAFSLDLLVALACQETGFIWSKLRRKGLDENTILALCVGDVIDGRADGSGRRAFPRDRAALLAVEGGEAMFAIARQALIDMARHFPAYQRFADQSHRFCRGYGLFQRDLQFFKEDPEYFLERKYERFEETLAHALGELVNKQRRIGLDGRERLSVLEMVHVAIAYNTGRFDPRRGLKQGFKSADGKFYGEAVFDYLRLAETVPVGDTPPLIEPPSRPGESILPPPSPLTATGPFMRVRTRITSLLLRSEPRKSRPNRANVIGEMPDGHPVRAFTGELINGYIAIETSLNGALLRGFAADEFLVPAPELDEVPVVTPVPSPEAAKEAHGIRAVWMPRPGNHVTRRKDTAGAHSLNEPGQPGRSGEGVDTLRAELAAIIAWLDVGKATHLRYKPRSGLTFCNIYAHDYCHLAGVYLPRVWWSEPALQRLAGGRDVEPLYGNTIREMRANDLFRWLRDFGHLFGWRQTGTLTKLQLAANQGGIGLIVARRKEDNRSGHIVVVVPETDLHRARRGTDGEVIAPLQSQAGTSNFNYGTGQAGWWNKEVFAENAFWVHA